MDLIKPMLVRKTLPVVLTLFILTGVSAQQQDPPLNYGFVSPNTREGLKLTEAIEGLNSKEEWILIRLTTNLQCVVQTKISVYSALGSWSDGAEHSTMFQVSTDEPTIRYLVSRLGRDADQKAVLYFHTIATGPSKLYILRPTRIQKFETIIRVLDRAGIVHRTLVPTRKATFIYIVDTENNLREKVSSAARLLKARVSIRTGTAQFIGDDSQRDKARAIYSREVEQYETKHPALPDACRGN